MDSRSSTNEAFEALKVFLIENYGAKPASGGKEIVKRCHICGDSVDQTSKHMYIGVKDGVIVYNCFKCNAKGVVDGNFFRRLGCYDINMIELCNSSNKKSRSYNDTITRSRFIRNKSPILMYRNAPESLSKLAYVNNRLGTKFTINDLASLKIVLNLYDFIHLNQVGDLTRYKDICDQLDEHFVGFLSLDNAYLNMRRIIGEGIVYETIDKRYVNYNIYGFQDNSSRYYVLPGSIDIRKPVTIYISEGPFDILGIYFNTDCDRSNSMFASIGGKSYMSLVQFIILQFGLLNFKLHIYVDEDIDNYEIYKISNLIRCFGITTFMHRNTYPGEKDFGVCRDHIKDSIVRI